MTDLERLLEKDRIIDTLTELFVATDRRDWRAVRACFTPEVIFDMRSLGGAAPATLPADQIVAGWQQGLEKLRAVHHQAGNFQVHVEDRSAKAHCYGIASHYLPNPTGRNTRVFVGSYDFRLEKEQDSRWRISLFRFNLKYIDGNADLERS